jgi:hypothetical protein
VPRAWVDEDEVVSFRVDPAVETVRRASATTSPYSTVRRDFAVLGLPKWWRRMVCFGCQSLPQPGRDLLLAVRTVVLPSLVNVQDAVRQVDVIDPQSGDLSRTGDRCRPRR